MRLPLGGSAATSCQSDSTSCRSAQTAIHPEASRPSSRKHPLPSLVLPVSIVLVALACALSTLLVSTPSAEAYTAKEAHNGMIVHEYIANLGVFLYDLKVHGPQEASAYRDQIINGARHEDEMDHVWDYNKIYMRLFQKGNPNMSYITHFWDADRGPDADVQMSSGNENNAWIKAQKLWGMAVGEYMTGDKARAYEYLGHVAHLLSDMTVPAHVHDDSHPAALGDDDCYEEWMVGLNAVLNSEETRMPACEKLSPSRRMGRIPSITSSTPPTRWATTSPRTAPGWLYPFYSNKFDGDGFDLHGGWMSGVYASLGMDTSAGPRDWQDLGNNDDGNNDNDGDLSTIRRYAYPFTFRAVASLFKLFEEKVRSQPTLTVLIDEAWAKDDHDAWPLTKADFFSRVKIGDFWFRNEGDQNVGKDHIWPGWAFARPVAQGSTVPVHLEIWDEDETSSDDQSDLNPSPSSRSLDLVVDLSTGRITGDVNGMVGAKMSSTGNNDWSQIKFRILTDHVQLPQSEPLMLQPSGDYSVQCGAWHYFPFHYLDITDLSNNTRVFSSSSVDWSKDIFNLRRVSDQPTRQGMITGVTVTMRVARDGAAEDRASAAQVVQIGGQQYPTILGTKVDDTGAGLDFHDYSYTWGANPATGQFWTWDDVEQLKAGVWLRAPAKGGGTTYCSELWAAVEYVDPALTQPVSQQVVSRDNALFRVEPGAACPPPFSPTGKKAWTRASPGTP